MGTHGVRTTATLFVVMKRLHATADDWMVTFVIRVDICVDICTDMRSNLCIHKHRESAFDHVSRNASGYAHGPVYRLDNVYRHVHITILTAQTCTDMKRPHVTAEDRMVTFVVSKMALTCGQAGGWVCLRAGRQAGGQADKWGGR